MNNTHTVGLAKDNRKVGGVMQIKSGIATPTGNILERSLRSLNSSIDVTKLAEQ
jgi:hypothetical protein